MVAVSVSQSEILSTEMHALRMLHNKPLDNKEK
jgi:hypothetical protein